ncbi:MAG TPA: PAS domain S-box protein [Natrialbaceae archaeon]|nr:PAS domain S-box protein [Natrialbaceae archaeon]
MTSQDISGSVHLAMANEDRRSRFAAWVADAGHAVTQGLDDLPSTADLYLLDPGGARRVADALRDRKRTARPVRVPTLLVISSTETPVPADVNEGLIDDVLVAPYDRAETRHRVTSLLQSRRLSLEATTHRRRYRQLVTELSEAVFLLRRGRVEYVNDTGRRLLGEDADPLGRRFLDVVHPDDRADVEAAFGGGGPSGTFQEARLVTGDGSVVNVELKGVGTARETDESLPRQVIVRERRSHEYAREMARERIEGTLERISDGFVAIDEEWRITYANEQAEALLGYATERLVGGSIWSVLPAGSDRQFEPHLEHAMSTGEAVTFTDRYPPLSSWFEVNVYPAENGLSVYFRDVTERKERKRELERYETIVQTASDPIFTLDAEGRFARINDEMVAFTGYDRDRLLGSHATLLVPQVDYQRALDRFEELANEDPDGRRTVELGVEIASGEERTCEVSIGLLPSEGEGRFGAIGVVHDVTDRIRREQRLSVLDRVLRHNLRNKMNVIVGRVDEILAAGSGGDPVENAREIRRVAEALLTLGEEARRFQDVLDADAERAEVHDLVAITATVVDEVAADHPAATIEADLPDSAPVRASGVVELAIEEVVENAVVHNDGDEPTVEVEGSVAPDGVELLVRDDGPGIPEEEVAVIETGTETALDHGSGLGLWLVYWTVTKYGGTVSFEDTGGGGRGTTVRLWLPTADDGDGVR